MTGNAWFSTTVGTYLLCSSLWCGCEPDPADRSRLVPLVYCYAAQVEAIEAPDDHHSRSLEKQVENEKTPQKNGAVITIADREIERAFAQSQSTGASDSRAAKVGGERPESTAASKATSAAAPAKQPLLFEPTLRGETNSKLRLFGTNNCAACEYARKKLTEAGVPFDYIKVKGESGVTYPYALQNGKRLEYDAIQELARKESK